MRVLIARRRSTPPPVSGAGVPNVEASRNDVDRRDGEAMDYQKGVKILVLAAVAGGTLFLLLSATLPGRGYSWPFLVQQRSTVELDGSFSIRTTSRHIFRDNVRECASPKRGGYVYGGGGSGGGTETSRILRFVHRSRSHGQGEAATWGGNCKRRRFGNSEYGCEEVPSLEETIFQVWEAKRAAGVLWFDVKSLDTRRDVGEKGWECVFVSNPGRSKPFPPPEPAEAPWDASRFNFYKADPLEFMFEYVPSFRHEADSSRSNSSSSSGVSTTRRLKKLAEPPEIARSDADTKAGALRTGRGAGRTVQQDSRLEGKREGAIVARESEEPVLSTVECGDVLDSSPPEHAVIVNVRPVGPVSVLLTPGYARSLHQRATPEALAVAMDFSEALMTTPNFRLGFNSGGSSASVNHLHFQCWHFDAGPRGMPLEVATTVSAGTLPLPVGFYSEKDATMEVHALDDRYPIRGLVFHTLGKDLEAAGEVIAKCVDILVRDDTPYTMLFGHGRAFLLPRQPLKEPPFAAVPGFPELSGEIIITSENDFPAVTADTVFQFWRDSISVGEERFNEITKACLESS